MNQNLHYQISNWQQITECLSNNSRNLYLSLCNIVDGRTLKGRQLRVEHPQYGVLFAAMISGHGQLISDDDEEGVPIPFLTTEEILKQLQKFGFYITYNVKSNLPSNVLNYLINVQKLGFDKITLILVQTTLRTGGTYWRPHVIVMKTESNPDLLTYGCKIGMRTFNSKLQDNVILNASEEPGLIWDWVDHLYNITDILDENVDVTDEFHSDYNIPSQDDEERGFEPYTGPTDNIPVLDHPGLTMYDSTECSTGGCCNGIE